MPDKFVVPDNNTEPDLDGETDIEYIFTSDKVKGDPRGLTGVFSLSGKINVVLQKIVNAIAWLKANQRVIPDASETEKGVVEKATQAEVNTGTDTDTVVTPATFRGSDVIQSVLPKGDLPTFWGNEIRTDRLSVTSEIIGSLGIFKVTISSISYRNRAVAIVSDKWIPMPTDTLTYYNLSQTDFSKSSDVDWQTYNEDNNYWRVGELGVDVGDIVYILMLKVR